MTTFTFANNVSTTLAGAISSSATSFTLSSSAHLPASIPAGEYLAITLNDVATRANFEVIYVGTVTGATCSNLLRGQEGTAALSWLTNDYAYSAPTAGQQESFGQLAEANTWTGANTFDEPVIVPNATAPGDAVNLGQAQADFAALNGSTGETFNVAEATTPTEAIPFGQLPSQFPSYLATNGWKKYLDPNSPTGYFIEQWGQLALIANSTPTAFNLPIAFPNVFLSIVGSFQSTLPPNNGSCGFEQDGLSQISATNTAAGGSSNGVFFFAKGY